MKILFLTTVLPRKRRMGSEVASQCFIDALKAAGYNVTVMGYQRSDDIFALLASEVTIGQRCIETRKAKLNVFVWLLLGFLKDLPYSAAKYYSRDYVRVLKQALTTEQYDRVIIDHPQLAWLEKYIPDQSQLLTISHNIEHQLYLDIAKRAKNILERWIYEREARLVCKLEHRLAAIAQQVWTLTENDAQYFMHYPHKAYVRPFDLPPGLASAPVSPSTKSFDIGIIGSWEWKPNLEGLEWFLEEVYPYLPQQLSIHIAGRGAEGLTDKYPNIQYHGFVPNAQGFMAQARVVAVPTLTGGGIQIKTLDAIASGSLIVGTTIALRGIVDPPATVQVANHAEEFARCLIAASQAKANTSDTKQTIEWFEQRKHKFLADIQQAMLLNNSPLPVLAHQ
jgi:polysaccharide biosynthesis protein PslH